MASNIRAIEQDDYLDIVKALRNIADDIEQGKHGNPRVAIMMLEASDGRIDPFAIGPGARDHMRALGLWRLGEDYMIGRIRDNIDAQD